jgi:4-amino-4-deoxy-L-arabinose transferase-like glycosyltransferase
VLPAVAEAPAPRRFRAFRLVSVFFHVLALACVYGAAREAFRSEGAALGAAAVAGLNPMFAFVGAGVSNDPSANFCAALVLWLGARLLRKPASAGDAAAFGLAVGAACVSKMSAVVPSLAAFGFLAFRRRLDGPRGALALALAAAVAGPVFWRNVRLYGDPLAARAIYAVEPVAAGWTALPGWFVSAFESSWAVFGWMTIRVPEPYYAVLWVLAGLAAAGAALSWRKERPFPGDVAAFLGLAACLVFAQGAFYGATSLQAQGRYMFVGWAAFAPFALLGLRYWAEFLPRGARPAAWGLLILFLAALHAESLSRIAEAVFVVPGVFNPKGL